MLPAPHRHSPRRSVTLVVGACVVLAALLFSTHVDASPRTPRHRPRTPRPPAHVTRRAPTAGTPQRAAAIRIEPVPGWPHATLQLAPARPHPVPPSFLGLSTEYWTLPHYARDRRLFERVVDLLHVPGTPLTLRIGGNSADMSWWDPHRRRAPGWAYALTPGWLARTARLVADAHLQVVLDLNLVDRNPAREAQLARAFVARMPPGTVRALEIGNEPDLYPVQGGLGDLATAAHERVARYFAWAGDYSPATYDAQFSDYAAALARAGVTAPLAGPALSDPSETEWLPGLIAGERRRLAFVSAHRYPLSACELDRSASDYPTIRRLLSEGASAGLARSVKAAVLIAHRAGLPFHVTEFNSVTCGGTRAVSGTFANALWAPDALFSLMRTGVDAVDVHVRARALNAPFYVSRRGVRAKPMLYGLLLFQRMLRRQSVLQPATLRAPAGARLKAWAVRSGGDLRLLLIDEGGRGADVRLRIAGRGPAAVQRLLAASPASRRGVTLAGQTLAPDGLWRGRFTAQRVPRTARGYEVAVPRFSAAMVTVAAG